MTWELWNRISAVAAVASAVILFAFAAGGRWTAAEGASSEVKKVQQSLDELNKMLKAEYVQMDVYKAEQKQISTSLESLSESVQKLSTAIDQAFPRRVTQQVRP